MPDLPLFDALISDTFDPEPESLRLCRALLAGSATFEEVGIDRQSANAVVTVFDGLTKPENRAKFRRLIDEDLCNAAEIAWRLVK